MKWYVIHTQSGHENKLKNAIEATVAAEGMQDKFGEILVPEVEIEESKGGKKKVIKRNYYPGYIFIEMDYDEFSWALVKGVAMARKPAFIGERKRFTKKDVINKPVPVRDTEIAKIRQIIEEGDAGITSELVYEKGEVILIKEGPFEGFKAVIDEVKEQKEKLDVLVNIFGRSTPVELSFSQVEKVED